MGDFALERVTNRVQQATHAGWRTIGGQRHYFRSRWEANYAHTLQLYLEKGEIKQWEYEPETFWFEGIKRGVCSYKPDFRVTENNGEQIYHEVKGWMDKQSFTKLKRMKLYHPAIKIRVIDGKWFAANASKLRWIIKDWEK